MTDVEAYSKAMMTNNLDWALEIEDRYCLRGYPPEIVHGAIAAAERGEDVDKYIDEATTPTPDKEE